MVEIWKIMWLFIVVVTTFVIIMMYGPGLGGAMDAALRQDARYAASEIAGAISLVAAGSDGTRFAYTLPRTDQADCVQIYRTYVKVDLAGVATADIVQSGTPINVTALDGTKLGSGDDAARADWDAIKLTCSRKESKQLIIKRKEGQVRFEMEYGG